MNKILDDITHLKQIDQSNMIGCIENFVEQCKTAEENARRQLDQFADIKPFQNIVMSGMGGSAIGADLMRAYVQGQSEFPIEVVRHYSLPKYVNQHTLFIASSYSGNTEETLAGLNEARMKEAQIIAITTGGELLEQCKFYNFPHITFPSGLQPRAALGFSFITLLILFEKLNIAPNQQDSLQQLYHVIQDIQQKNNSSIPAENNPAKQLASELQSFLPVIYSGQDAFEPVATRWRGQFNENAKTLAHTNVIPEMNHNEILGWTNPVDLTAKSYALFLEDKNYHPKIKQRMEITKNILLDSGHKVSTITASGEGLLARMFSLIYFADFVSVYLAILYNQDPTPIPEIDLLKHELGK